MPVEEKTKTFEERIKELKNTGKTTQQAVAIILDEAKIRKSDKKTKHKKEKK